MLLYCASLDYLRCKTYVDGPRLRTLDPAIDLEMLAESLRHLCQSCDSTPEGGPVKDISPGRRFRWLTAPRSTLVQTSPTHTGLTDNPDADLERLFERLVLPPN
ncbi:hypothetical protein [Alloactinosynnema sp. L-07]|nr:hypothetical protein [Alloactinosynnema sp. L-07]